MKYVIKGGGSVLTKKDQKIPLELDTPKDILEYLIKNKRKLMERENIHTIIDGCAELVRKGDTVYFVLGGGIFAHPLAKKAGFPNSNVEDMAIINYSMHVFTSDVVDICYRKKDIEVVPLYYASFVRENKLPKYIRNEGRLYVMSSFVSDRPQVDGAYEPIGSDDICISLATHLKSDYNVMITKRILKDTKKGEPLEDGTYTIKEFHENVEIAKTEDDITGGLARKIELATELVNRGQDVYIMPPEEFLEFVKNKNVGIRLVKGD